MTTMQYNVDGTLTDDERGWLARRASGGFGLVTTCASHVQGWLGQLGIWSDTHLNGLVQIARAIKSEGVVSSLQLHQAGRRAPRALTGEQPIAPWRDAEFDAPAHTMGELEGVIGDFAKAANRAERAGFDAVTLHAGHGHLIAQFLDPVKNVCADRYGGTFENRKRVLLDIIDHVRDAVRPGFQLGVRPFAERYGITIIETRALATELMGDGKIMEAATARACLEHGAGYVTLGCAAILHADFHKRIAIDPSFRSDPGDGRESQGTETWSGLHRLSCDRLGELCRAVSRTPQPKLWRRGPASLLGIANLSGTMQGLLEAPRAVHEVIEAKVRHAAAGARLRLPKLIAVLRMGQRIDMAFVATIDAPERLPAGPRSKSNSGSTCGYAVTFELYGSVLAPFGLSAALTSSAARVPL
jgi:hypothetical protein